MIFIIALIAIIIAAIQPIGSRGTVFYRNRNDPRTFIYVDENCRWSGVKLNHARPLSWLITLLTVPAWLLLVAAIVIGIPACGDYDAAIWIIIGKLLTYRLSWALIFVIGAKWDLRRHPGPAAERPKE